MSSAPIWRNIFSFDEEDPDWQTAIADFPNRVPRFTSSEECKAFIGRHCSRGSNPLEPSLRHSISTLTEWSQVTSVLLPKIQYYKAKWGFTPPTKATTLNKPPEGVDPPQDKEEEAGLKTSRENAAKIYTKSRLNLPIHSFQCSFSVENTLKYLFFHMRCGIYAMIRNKQIAIFAPFVNKHYTNTWGDALNVGYESVEDYYQEKSKTFRDENYITDKKKFWANGNIICNVESEGSYWGDQFLFQIKDMVAETCRTRDVPDCEFFINKRDYPQLKYHETLSSNETKAGKRRRSRGYPVEPYGFIFDKDDRDPSQDIPLAEHAYKSYAPILSFYTSSRFADIPIPPSEDWEAATGEIFPPSFSSSEDENGQIVVQNPRELFTSANLKKFDCSFDDKVPTAFFRGTATGGGVTIETNQRLHLAHLSHQWEKQMNIEESVPLVPKLDAKITGWNPRDKKIAGSSMTFIRPKNFPFKGGKENFVEIYKQSRFKYLIYAEGHCAACRYGFMMLLGSVILKVESKCVADQLWYFPMLTPWEDHVPVKADLSDLEEKIDWCRENDDKCREIAMNARKLYEKCISREGIIGSFKLFTANCRNLHYITAIFMHRLHL